MDLAVMVNAQALQVHLRLPDRDLAVTARLLVRLTMRSVCLGHLGQNEEAITAGDDTVDWYCELAPASPKSCHRTRRAQRSGQPVQSRRTAQESPGDLRKTTDLYLDLWQGGATYVLPDLARSMSG